MKISGAIPVYEILFRLFLLAISEAEFCNDDLNKLAVVNAASYAVSCAESEQFF